MANNNVVQILNEQYRIATHPGAKVRCPFCHKQTLSIKKDDSLAKCFHSACGRFITATGAGVSQTITLASVLADNYHDFHQELLGLKNVEYPSAYAYLVEDRRIHPRAVEDSMLGAVPGGGYDLDRKFQPLIDSIQVPAAPPPKTKGRPPKRKEFTPEG